MSQPEPGVLRITIHEGRNRQVRRMCEAVGHPVTRLVRTRIGPLQRPPPPPGTWRHLTPAEVIALAEPTGAPDAAPDGPRRPSTVRCPAVNDRPRRATVIGLGLIGGSIALALRKAGWHVAGDDIDAGRVDAAPSAAACIDAAGVDPHSELTFVAVPVLAVPDQVKRALAETAGVVTDVGSVKGTICRGGRRQPLRRRPPDGRQRARRPRRRRRRHVRGRRVGAHARAGDGRRHVRRRRRGRRRARCRGRRAGAEHHDEMVAVVSHVPHLTAAGLMGLAADRGEEHAALLRLAAGGFRDMTRIASGQPDIWLDICAENRPAIVAALDGLIEQLGELRRVVGADDRPALRERLQRAREARTNLPIRVTRPEELAEVRIPIPDRTGAAAEVFTLAAQLGVNIASFEVVHVAESNRGVAVVLIDADAADLFRGGLIARGFRPAVTRLQ